MITRADLSAEAETLFGPTVKTIEDQIDALLREHVKKHGMRGYVTHSPVGNYQIATEIVNRYQRNGYKAEYVSDQREGDFIQIWLT